MTIMRKILPNVILVMNLLHISIRGIRCLDPIATKMKQIKQERPVKVAINETLDTTNTSYIAPISEQNNPLIIKKA